MEAALAVLTEYAALILEAIAVARDLERAGESPIEAAP
jgi:hypothetical protein